jgi:two-component system, response regulator
MNKPEYEILLVEDDPGDAELTVLALREAAFAHRVVLARDGAEALDLLFCRGAYVHRRFESPPHLVLLDLKLPRINGHEVLRTIKGDERTRAIPVIVLTSSDRDRDLVQCYKLGVNSYIQKPSELLKYQETVRDFARYWLTINHMPPPETFKGQGLREAL